MHGNTTTTRSVVAKPLMPVITKLRGSPAEKILKTFRLCVALSTWLCMLDSFLDFVTRILAARHDF